MNILFEDKHLLVLVKPVGVSAGPIRRSLNGRKDTRPRAKPAGVCGHGSPLGPEGGRLDGLCQNPRGGFPPFSTDCQSRHDQRIYRPCPRTAAGKRRLAATIIFLPLDFGHIVLPFLTPYTTHRWISRSTLLQLPHSISCLVTIHDLQTGTLQKKRPCFYFSNPSVLRLPVYL